MKVMVSALLSLAVGLVLVAAVGADEGKQVTLKGTITCAKCDLKLQNKCATVVKVNEDGKDVVYYFSPDSNSKYHKKICTEAKEGTVTGTVHEANGKKVIKVTKLEFKD